MSYDGTNLLISKNQLMFVAAHLLLSTTVPKGECPPARNTLNPARSALRIAKSADSEPFDFVVVNVVNVIDALRRDVIWFRRALVHFLLLPLPVDPLWDG
jgi:hypothetical protein